MNVIWVVADTFRRDHIGAYGNPTIRTPNLDALAARSIRFDRHYSGGFPTHAHQSRPPRRAAGTMSFMGWQPLPEGVTTLAEMLAERGLHTAAAVDTPYYLRDGMNYDRGFQSFFMNRGQDTLWSLIPQPGYHNEALDVRAAWRYESDRNAPRTFYRRPSGGWSSTTRRTSSSTSTPGIPTSPGTRLPTTRSSTGRATTASRVLPLYGNWHDVPGYAEDKMRKGHAAYCGEITMVDTWLGHLLKSVENMGLTEKTAVIFTTGPRLLLWGARRPLRQDER